MIILYGEDDIEDFDIFCEVVKSLNPTAECINTTDGSETLQFLDNAIILPDLIFLDINMPSMDGKACLKIIKRDERLKTIPVIVYTTSNNVRDREHCLELGATEFVQKPNSLAEVRQKLSRFVQA